MVKNERNRQAYSEVFDMDALRELGQMAFYDVAVEEGCNIPKGQKHIPDGTYSDFACNVWEYMTELVRDGMKLQKSLES